MSNTTIAPAQLSERTFLYVWTATHVGKLNRRNKLSSPPLEIPEPVAAAFGTRDVVESLRIVLLRGVVRSSTDNEADDPIGVFLQCQFRPKPATATAASTGGKSEHHLRCVLSVSCTPVRPDGHAHSGGPDDIVLTPEDNFLGMRSLLPAVAIKVSGGSGDDSEAERHFAESTPVEFHVTIQFLPPKALAEQQQNGAAAAKPQEKSALDQAASLFGGFTSSASATLGSWFSSASAVVAESKDKMLPSVKAALSTAANKAESLAQQLLDRKEKPVEVVVSGSAGAGASAAASDGAPHAVVDDAGLRASAASESNSSSNKAPWDDVPSSYREREDDNSDHAKAADGDAPPPPPKMTPQRWRRLVLETMAEDESCFLWAPESAFGAHRGAQHHDDEEAKGGAGAAAASPSRLSQLRPQYPEYTFDPDEELLLSRIGLSARLLLRCNDTYNFDSDVEPHFVDPRNPATATLRHMRLRLVPRVVSEERFWAAYLWRVACLALCTNVEQEGVVKTLLRKPAVAVVKAPSAAAGHDEHDAATGAASAAAAAASAAAEHGASPSLRANSSGSNAAGEGQSVPLPDVDALLADAEEAQSLFDEVVEEVAASNGGAGSDGSPNSAAALLVASQNGVERCIRNTTEAIAVLDRAVADERAEEKWRAARVAQREQLLALKARLEAAVERGKQAREGAARQPQKPVDDEVAPAAPVAAVAATVASPPPKAPEEAASPTAAAAAVTAASEEKGKSSPTAAGSTSPLNSSKPRTPVLMPWEEDDD